MMCTSAFRTAGVYRFRIAKNYPTDKIGLMGMEMVGAGLQHNIKSYVGVSCDVHVVEEGKVERTIVGKAKRVVDKRPK